MVSMQWHEFELGHANPKTTVCSSPIKEKRMPDFCVGADFSEVGQSPPRRSHAGVRETCT